MPLNPTYSVGTVTVSANGLIVTGSGTQFVASGIQNGDIFEHGGLTVTIQSADSATQLTLVKPWPGAAISGAAYEVRYTADASRVLTAARAAIDEFGAFRPDVERVRAALPYATRADAIAATIPATIQFIEIDGLRYRSDAGGTALETAGGRRWAPLGTATPRHFGAVGDYATDDTAAIDAWLTYFTTSGDPLWIGPGVYRYNGKRMTLPRSVIIDGAGGPGIAAYPQRGAEKDKLRAGLKHTLTGAVIIFSGTPADAAITTTRSDRFATMNPMVYYPHAEPHSVKGLQFIQDMNVLDGTGAMTTASTDGRASGFDCGYVNKGYGARIGAQVFGYFPKSGIVSLAVVADGIQDPDYVDLSGCVVTSGIAVVGAATTAEADGGNTGCKGTGVQAYGSDHHNRADTDPNVPTLYVDGATGGTGSGIRGVTFTASSFRGYANDAIVLGTCDDFSLLGCTTEFSTWAVAGLDVSGVIKGSATTGNVTLMGLAATSNLGLAQLAVDIRGNFTFAQAGEFDTFVSGRGGAGVAGDMSAVRVFGNSSKDPVVQLTRTLSSSVSGWSFRMDQSDSEIWKLSYGNVEMFNITTTGIPIFKSMPTSVPAPSNSLWADPADGYRVKYKP